MKRLENLKALVRNGSVTLIAKLPLPKSDPFYSDWISYNGNAKEYEIRQRLSKSRAKELGLT